MRFHRFITVNIQSVMLWGLASCSLKRLYRRFGRNCSLFPAYKCVPWWQGSRSLRKFGGLRMGYYLIWESLVGLVSNMKSKCIYLGISNWQRWNSLTQPSSSFWHTKDYFESSKLCPSISVAKTNSGMVFKIMASLFHSHYSQFIIHLPVYHSMLFILSHWQLRKIKHKRINK